MIICGIVIFTCDDYYRSMNATWTGELFFLGSGYLMGKTLEKRQRHTILAMTQIANVLAVAAVFFIGLWTLISAFDSQRRGLTGKTKIPMQELEPKVQGGLCMRGSVIAGFYSYCTYIQA